MSATALTIRKLPWDFGDDTPFLWNADNPQFSLAMNALSFIAPAFERFIVSATRGAMALIADTEVRVEADAFLRQEALHARAHRNHTAALVRRYPGLQSVLEDVDARFDHLMRTRPLSYQLAYVADIEATFTPFFNVILRHGDTLFDNGDHRVAPLFLWHLVEEIEHRSSAKVIYDAAVPFPWYRLRVAPGVFVHILGCFNAFCRAVDLHVPAAERGLRATDMIVGRSTLLALLRPTPAPGLFAAVPRREIAVMIYRLARSQTPGHLPATEETPPFADEWLTAFDNGADVVRWYDVRAS
jgi:predicted metal-dependent hydrolase